MSTILLRHKLISNVEFIIDSFIEQAKDDSYENQNLAQSARQTIWNAILPMIQQAGDLQQLEAKNAGEVIKAVTQGKITFDEAKQLMDLFRQQTDIEELPKLREALENMENK